jgi:Polysaccharide pyruvyl transferase
MRALVCGWFSFEEMGATAGDLLSRDLVCDRLRDAGLPYDVALAEPFEGGVRWDGVDPGAYTHLVFVCGPFGNGWPITELLPRFPHCRLVGVNLSMLQPLEEWNPFDLLLERDSSRTSRPDVSFLSTAPLVPVVGVVLVHPQSEYEGGRHAEVEAAIRRLLQGRDLAVVDIDTRLDVNRNGMRTAAEVESVVARMDVVVTTRLHGLVLALKNGVPVVAVDPISGGAKVATQAAALGWPHAFTADRLDEQRLGAALDACLDPSARQAAAETASRARARIAADVLQLLDFGVGT